MKKFLLLIISLMIFSQCSWSKDRQVRADVRFINPAVGYILVSDAGENVDLGIVYTERKSKSEITSVVFTTPAEIGQDGKVFTFSTDQGKVFLTFNHNGTEVENVKVKCDYQPDDSGAAQKKRYVLVSKAGYKVFFDFFWENKQLNLVKVHPRIHPFFDYR
ncbi:MAG: hypothetical protein JW867_06440 [Candidatus Omnitrophica bacterium]|nr:hypothetical protein [Candidatus Omnitrophota bacterium]